MDQAKPETLEFITVKCHVDIFSPAVYLLKVLLKNLKTVVITMSLSLIHLAKTQKVKREEQEKLHISTIPTLKM